MRFHDVSHAIGHNQYPKRDMPSREKFAAVVCCQWNNATIPRGLQSLPYQHHVTVLSPARPRGRVGGENDVL